MDRLYSLALDPAGERLWYAGYDLHALDLRAIASPRDDLERLERELGLTPDGVTVRRR